MIRVETKNGTIMVRATTKDLREIAAECRRVGCDRQLTPAQVKLLDPHPSPKWHFISPVIFRGGDKDDLYIGCNVFLKLIGTSTLVQAILDIPSECFEEVLTNQDLLALAAKTSMPPTRMRDYLKDHPPTSSVIQLDVPERKFNWTV